MAIKLTKNQIKDTHDIIVPVGYCALQNLLYNEKRIGYMSGVYGWNADVYSFRHKGHRIAIVTGYRTSGFGKGKEVVHIPSEQIHLQEWGAEQRVRKLNWKYQTLREANAEAIGRFLDEVIRIYETPVSKRRD